MPSFKTAQTILNPDRQTLGNIRKNVSDVIMEATWDGDIQSKQCYIYDYYHDGERELATGLSPETDPRKTPIEAKYIVTQYPTLSKDQVEYHIEFKPSQRCPLDYYAEYTQKFGARFPVGLYIDIPNEQKIYERWLICSLEYANQFIKYSVLPCNYRFHWVKGGKTYDMWGIARLRNSYNSGLWTDYIMTAVENQDQLWLPMNDVSKYIFYDDRFIIDARQDGEIEPQVTWKVSKVENIHPCGLNKITLSQTVFNRDTDRFVDGAWYADYAATRSEPTSYEKSLDNPPENPYGEISYTGSAAEVKIYGGFKGLAVAYHDKDGNDITAEQPDTNVWNFFVDGTSVDELIETEYPTDTFGVRIKFKGGYEYIDKVLDVQCVNGDITASLKLDIVAL